MTSTPLSAQAVHQRAVAQNIVLIRSSGNEYPVGTSVEDILDDEEGAALVVMQPSTDGSVFHATNTKYKSTSPHPPAGVFSVVTCDRSLLQHNDAAVTYDCADKLREEYTSLRTTVVQASWLASLMIFVAVGVIATAFTLAYGVFKLDSSLSQALASVATTTLAAFVYSLRSIFAFCCPNPEQVPPIVACLGILSFILTFIPAFYAHGAASAFLFNFSTSMLVSALGVLYFEAIIPNLRKGFCLPNTCPSCKRPFSQA